MDSQKDDCAVNLPSKKISRETLSVKSTAYPSVVKELSCIRFESCIGKKLFKCLLVLQTNLTLIFMGYFDYLFYFGGGAKKPPSLTLAFN